MSFPGQKRKTIAEKKRRFFLTETKTFYIPKDYLDMTQLQTSLSSNSIFQRTNNKLICMPENF